MFFYLILWINIHIMNIISWLLKKRVSGKKVECENISISQLSLPEKEQSLPIEDIGLMTRSGYRLHVTPPQSPYAFSPLLSYHSNL